MHPRRQFLTRSAGLLIRCAGRCRKPLAGLGAASTMAPSARPRSAMSEQDDAGLDADVIEQASRQFTFPAIRKLPFLRGITGTRRRWRVVTAAAGALLVTAATLVTFRLAAGPRADPALTG